MNVSSISNRSVAGRLLRLPLALIPGALPMPVLQGPLRGHWWITGSSNHGCWLGSYEYAKQRLFARMIHSGDVVFDIGANVGFYTLLAASRVRVDGVVVAFEPLRQNTHFLRRHLRINRFDGVRVIEAAVGKRNGTAHFQPHASSAMGRVSENGSLVVEQVSLDELCDVRAIPDPMLMKIDVEGAELNVLEGASRMLARARPAIFLATHGALVHRECCDFLRAAGYSLRPIDDSISSIDTTDEILATPRDSHVTA